MNDMNQLHRNFNMKRTLILSLAGLTLLSGGLALLSGCGKKAAGSAPVSAAMEKKKPKRWRSPMDPNEIYDHPGKDSMGMDFIPIDDDATEESAPGGFKLGDARQQLIGVRTEAARLEPFVRTLRASARLAADETRAAHIHVKVAGTVENLYADFTGKPVTRGQPLLTIYSPELYATQQDYLNAFRSRKTLSGSSLPEVRQGGDALLEASRQRLRLWDIGPGEIARLERSGAVRKSITLSSPVSGVVTLKNVYPGMLVSPDMELLQIADLSTLWVLADFYEADLGLLRVGQTTAITLDNLPGAPLSGKIQFIQPVLNPASRTVTVRIALPNPKGRLLPDMLAHVEIPVDEGQRLAVPESAVVMSGTRSLVFVQKAPGEFAPVEVVTGIAGNGRVEIKSGLKAGDVVATEGNFLLDSESRIKAASAIPAGEKSP
jgi:multidrug efflux pump subunit AcrA (membrane-fusion protein)